jgi:hypothetical protein
LMKSPFRRSIIKVARWCRYVDETAKTSIAALGSVKS